jgi:hypothetical protein
MNQEIEVILALADISGYTKFLRHHAAATSHAAEIMGRLLSRMVNSISSPIRVAEIEGDAVFFYALVDNNNRESVASEVAMQLAILFREFEAERKALSCLASCPCDACRGIKNLELKQVVHWGRASFQEVANFRKLFGLDVVLVHRMLKNSVPKQRYLMLTEPAFQKLRDVDLDSMTPKKGSEKFEGVGGVETRVYAGAHLDDYLGSFPTPSRSNHWDSWWTFGWKISMQIRTLLMGYRLREKESKTE